MSVTQLDEERRRLGLPDRDDVNPNDPNPAVGRSLAERAGDSVVAVDPQDGFFDVVVENDALEKALEARLTAKEALKPKVKAYNDADAAAKGIVAGLDEYRAPEVGEEPLMIRCGRFRIKVA